jgi:3-isopropylmalate dehydrogenase
MNYKIAVIAGDGIGPEVTRETVEVLKTIGTKYGHNFTFSHVLAGGCAIDATGQPLPEETLKTCLESDAVLLGAVGGPKWDTLPGKERPEMALFGLRSGLGLFANLRPAILYSALKEACPLKEELIKDGLDVLVVRELTGGIYFGERGRGHDDRLGETAYDMEVYSTMEVERITKVAFEMAKKRKGKVTSVDKANVLESSRLWRETVNRMAEGDHSVQVDHMYVDNASMQLVRDPNQFDVIVTSNLFGDILSDEASMITGSIGMLPSASIGSEKRGLFEPVHGSAPDIAGKDIANPIATIMSAAMMLRTSLDLMEEADAIESAVSKVLDAGYRTADIMSPGMQKLGTKAMGEAVRKAIG